MKALLRGGSAPCSLAKAGATGAWHSHPAGLEGGASHYRSTSPPAALGHMGREGALPTDYYHASATLLGATREGRIMFWGACGLLGLSKLKGSQKPPETYQLSIHQP